MMKKAAAPKLQDDIQSDKDLNSFLEKPGLLVLDIYSEWCGPCLGMVLSLRKQKLDVGGEHLSYAICKADTIEVFKRFRRKSEPTWLLVQNHKAVNIMFGCNVPNLITLINVELERLNFAKINYYELSEYQPEELKRLQIKEDAENRVLGEELQRKDKDRWNYLTKVTDTIMQNLTDMGVTVFGPQVERRLMKKILQKADQLKILCWDRKTVQISREHFENIHFDCPNPISQDILEYLDGKELLVCYWKVPGEGQDVTNILLNLARELQTSQTLPGDGDNEEDIVTPAILHPIEVKLKVSIEDGDILSDESAEKLVTPQKSDVLYLSLEGDEIGEAEEVPLKKEVVDIENESSKRTRTKKVQIPPIWVPNNQRTHAALIYTYFRNQTISFLPPDPIPEPPYIIMAFDAHKRKDLILHADRDKDGVPMYGFFTSDDAEDAEYISNSLNEYKPVTENDKIVLKVQRATSRTVLKFVTYGPSYVSPDLLVGQEEVLKFFPLSYKTANQEDKEEAGILNNQSKLKTKFKDADNVSIKSSIDKIPPNIKEENSSVSQEKIQAEAA